MRGEGRICQQEEILKSSERLPAVRVGERERGCGVRVRVCVCVCRGVRVSDRPSIWTNILRCMSRRWGTCAVWTREGTAEQRTVFCFMNSFFFGGGGGGGGRHDAD